MMLCTVLLTKANQTYSERCVEYFDAYGCIRYDGKTYSSMLLLIGHGAKMIPAPCCQVTADPSSLVARAKIT